MATEIPVGVRSIVQHDVLGALIVDLKRQRKRPIYPKNAPEADLLDGEIGGRVQVDGAVVTVALCPHSVTQLSGWVDACATRIMDTIANVDAIKAHVAERRPDWREPGGVAVGNVEFAGRLQLLSLSHHDDTMTATFNDGGLYGGHFFVVSIAADGKPDDDVDLAG